MNPLGQLRWKSPICELIIHTTWKSDKHWVLPLTTIPLLAGLSLRSSTKTKVNGRSCDFYTSGSVERVLSDRSRGSRWTYGAPSSTSHRCTSEASSAAGRRRIGIRRDPEVKRKGGLYFVHKRIGLPSDTHGRPDGSKTMTEGRLRRLILSVNDMQRTLRSLQILGQGNCGRSGRCDGPHSI